jgi:hypothetical protein
MTLAEEFRLFARYLLGVDVPDELTLRYVAAHERMLGPADDGSCAALRFVHRHPRALPYLDAALALSRTRPLLRKKIYLAAAILEASPFYAEFFLDRSVTPARALVTLGLCGLTSVAKLAIGLPLWMLASRLR